MRLDAGIGATAQPCLRHAWAGPVLPASLFTGNTAGFLYDPSRRDSLFQDAAATIPVTEAGQPVGCIRDLSGRGIHATQSTAAARPIYQTDGTLHWLNFDGVDDHLVTATITWGAGPVSMGVGVHKLSTDRATIIEGTGAPRFSLEGPGPLGQDFMGFLWTTLSVNASARVMASAPVSSVLTSSYDMATRTLTLTLNGATTATATATSGSGNFASSACTIGRRAGAAQYLSGRIYCILGLGRALSVAEGAQLTAWLNARTGAF